MRRFAALLLLIFPAFLFSQQSEADSLKQVLSEQGQDTNRVNTLLKLAWMIRNDEPSQAMDYSIEAVELASRLGYLKGKAAGLSTIGVINYRNGKLPEATKYHEQALMIREQLGDENGIARSDINLGNIYTDTHDTARAMEYYMNALGILERGDDKERQAIVCLDIGGLYLAENNDALAKSFSNRTYALAIEIDDPLLQAQALNNAGVCYEHLGMNDSAMWAYSTSYKIANDLSDKVMMVDAGMNVGKVYRTAKKYDEAIRWHNEMIAVANEMGYLDGLASSYEQLAQDYEAQGNYKLAYEAHVKFKSYSDSIYNEYNATRLSDITAKLESDQKDLEQKKLEMEMNRQAELKEQQRTMVMGGLILFVVMAGVIVTLLIWRSNRRRDQMIIEGQQAQINQLYWTKRTDNT